MRFSAALEDRQNDRIGQHTRATVRRKQIRLLWTKNSSLLVALFKDRHGNRVGHRMRVSLSDVLENKQNNRVGHPIRETICRVRRRTVEEK